ncbi:O-antigen ligase domain-containing protein [Mucisphaera sp.]|uniref:O-antigen ligase domain-containing protein n=1 Tax=Mucisphaera sp. TaxID=2913024 RepID=UPI003D0AE4C7
MGNAIAQVVMIAWIPAVLVLFVTLPARRAVVWAILLGWLMLPMTGYPLPGLPDYTKMSATCMGILLGSLLFDPDTMLRLKPRWVDLPFVVFCLSPFVSSVTNGLGPYDGMSATISQIVTWGLPYLIGRAYFSSTEGMKELARGLVIGGLIYVPLCLYEIRMSPQLHTMVYGFHQHSFGQTFRMGGWRPVVFMQHGLMVGMWMCMSALLALWFWRSGAIKQMAGFPMGWLAAFMTVTAILCKSTGAWILMALGMMLLLFKQPMLRVLLLAAIVLGPALYYGVRYPRIVSGGAVVAWADPFFSDQRIGSLSTRMTNEDQLSEHAMRRPLFGWGGWGRNRVRSEDGRDITITDGLWIIIAGTNGLMSLGAFTLAFSYPGWVLLRRVRSQLWELDWVPYFAGLTVVVLLYQVDCILNAMVNPVYTLVLGSLIGVSTLIPKPGRRA